METMQDRFLHENQKRSLLVIMKTTKEKGVKMSKTVKIIKLPLMGSPISIKTRKQGRTGSLSSAGNETLKNISKGLDKKYGKVKP